MATTSNQAGQVGDMPAAASVDQEEITPVSPYEAAVTDYIMPFGMYVSHMRPPDPDCQQTAAG